MKKLSCAAWAVAAYIGVCGLVHLPYMFLTRAGVVERSAMMQDFITIVSGPMICLAEVILFAYMLTKIRGEKSLWGAILTLLTVPAVSAIVRIGNFAAARGCDCLAVFWGEWGGLMNNISTLFSVVAIVALVWLALSLRRGLMARIMSWVATYDTVFTLIGWEILVSKVALPSWLHPFALVQFYVIWVLFYVALAKYYKPQER